MVSDKIIGVILFIIGVVGFLLYGWLLFFYSVSMTTFILQLTAILGVTVILAIIAWIGYTMATTPAPEPLDVGEIPVATNPSETPASKESEPEKNTTKPKK